MSDPPPRRRALSAASLGLLSVGARLAERGFERHEGSFVRTSASAEVAIVVALDGTKGSSAAADVPPYAVVTVELRAGRGLPKSSADLPVPPPALRDQERFCATVLTSRGCVVETEPGTASGAATWIDALTTYLEPMMDLGTMDAAIAFASARDEGNTFFCACLLACVGREEEARALFRLPRSGDSAHVAVVARRFGIEP